MSNDDDIVKTNIGEAKDLTMDSFMRTMVSQMFENDNDTAILEVVLNGTDNQNPPKLELEIRLTAINGVKTRSEDDGE